MKFKKKRSVGKGGGIHPLLFGILLNVALFPLFALLASAVVYTQSDPASITGIGGILSYLLCAATCGFVVSKKYSPSGFVTALASSVIFALLLLCAGLIFAKGSVGAGVLINHALYAATAALFGFIGSKKRERSHRRRRS